MEKSLEHFKRIERISRQTRHHRTFLNQLYDQKLHQELNHLNNEYEQIYLRSKKQQKIERQRKQLFNLTVQQIVDQKRPRDILNAHSSTKLITAETSCNLFSSKCQLYPCRPLHNYTSFIKKEHDQTIDHHNIKPQVQKSQPKLPEFSVTPRNQYHLANRYILVERIKGRLDEESRLLHERLSNKKIFDYSKGHKRELNQLIQHHLKNSAKFSG